MERKNGLRVFCEYDGLPMRIDQCFVEIRTDDEAGNYPFHTPNCALLWIIENKDELDIQRTGPQSGLTRRQRELHLEYISGSTFGTVKEELVKAFLNKAME